MKPTSRGLECQGSWLKMLNTDTGLTGRFLPQPSFYWSGCITIKDPVCPGVLCCLQMFSDQHITNDTPSFQHQQAELLQMDTFLNCCKYQRADNSLETSS